MRPSCPCLAALRIGHRDCDFIKTTEKIMVKRPEDSQDKNTDVDPLDLLPVVAGAIKGTAERWRKLFHRARSAVSKLPAENIAVDQELTAKQKADYDIYEYLTRCRVRITGKLRSNKSIVHIGSCEIKMTSTTFLLLMTLVAELKADAHGWVNIHDLPDRIGVKRVVAHQSFHRLRVALKIDLGEAKKLIENDQQEHYRLSTFGRLKFLNRLTCIRL